LRGNGNEAVAASAFSDPCWRQSEEALVTTKLFSAAEADKVIEALNGSDMNGRQLNVNVARERSEGDRRPRGGGGGGGGGGYGGGGDRW